MRLPRDMRRLAALLLVLAAVVLGWLMPLTFLQSKLLYFPARAVLATPADIGLAYEDVRFTTSDGVALHGWFIPAERARGTVLYFHGNAGNIGDRLDILRTLHALRLDTFLFDYRGYGESGGKPSEEGTYRDAEAAWGWLVRERGIEPSRIVLFGNSLGGAIAAHLAARVHPAGVILESTFTSVPDIAAELYPFLPARRLARFRYATIDSLKGIRAPLLVVHSRDDEIVPFAHGERLFAAAREPKSFLAIAGSHNEGFLTSGDAFFLGLDGFLSRVLEEVSGGGER